VFLADKLQRLIDDFAPVDDSHDRLAAVIDRSRRMPPLEAKDRVDANRVRGCVSVVWLAGELAAGRCYFRADAESPVVRGLVTFLCDFFNGAPVAEVADTDVDPLEILGLLQNLSPTRRNGLIAARNAIRAFAESSKSKRRQDGAGA
jgi:cysteine desulfuration protein SufE